MTISLPKGSLISLAGTDLSEHNRSSAQIDFESISLGERTLGGTLRKQFITRKRRISVSWENLPALDTQTVDGKAGRNTIKTLIETMMLLNNSSSALTYKEVNTSDVQTTTSLNVFVDSYNETLVRRADHQLWNISITFVEE